MRRIAIPPATIVRRIDGEYRVDHGGRARLRAGPLLSLPNVELGLRLRSEIVRELAPYMGIAWERRFGGTARYARADGEDVGGATFVAGVRLWF